MLLSRMFAAAMTFLTINNIYSTFASPTPESKGGIAARESLSGSASAVYTPANQKCRVSIEWQSRTCYNLNGNDGDWFDNCYTGRHYITKSGTCPPNQMCRDTLAQDRNDPSPKRTITCITRPTGYVDLAPNQQSGVEVVQNLAGINPIVSVTIANTIPQAVVSAVLEGSDQNFVVRPGTSLVGSLRGAGGLKLCDYNAINVDCLPTIPRTLVAGDIIDFTFTLSGTQVVRVYYAIGSMGI